MSKNIAKHSNLKYRPDIDGLRALAVLPVIFFHAGFEFFGGGFVGVDIFFVISGYLITTIILAELAQDEFSIVTFYERRARRILPALFCVMAASLVAGYLILMPDEFKNFGQSLVSTSLFANNILLGVTSGYWDLASEFKPLLHTWSLGVEEQYYFFVPLLLAFAWKYCKEKIPFLFIAMFAGSLLVASWLVTVSPKWAFYILPTRAWEISVGAISATLLIKNPNLKLNQRISNVLSMLGLLLIVFSMCIFDKSIQSPGLYLLIPTIGAALIILFSEKNTVVGRFLGGRIAVFVGLLSYSLYLWHQPVFAFLRASSDEKPGNLSFGFAIAFVFVLSYLSWKFIEKPFRKKGFVGRAGVFTLSVIGSLFFVVAGLFLNANYGFPGRAFDKGVKIEDMDKRVYNERVFRFKVDEFTSLDGKKLLIVGNSFARDFVNITLETYDTSKVEIVYRDDIRQCILPFKSEVSEKLFSRADVIVFSSGRLEEGCMNDDLAFASLHRKAIFYVGTKDFGYNLNWLIGLREGERSNRYNRILGSVIDDDIRMSQSVPSVNYISLISPLLVDGKMPITDEGGRMISTDRAHLTKYGAEYFGRKVVRNTSYSEVFM